MEYTSLLHVNLGLLVAVTPHTEGYEHWYIRFSKEVGVFSIRVKVIIIVSISQVKTTPNKVWYGNYLLTYMYNNLPRENRLWGGHCRAVH